MLEWEMLDIAVYRHELPFIEPRQSNVQNTVLVVGVLHNQEDHEITNTSRPHHRLVNLLPSFVENASSVRDDDQKLRHCRVSCRVVFVLHEHLAGQVQHGNHRGLGLIEGELIQDPLYISLGPLVLEGVEDLSFFSISQNAKLAHLQES